MLARELSIFLVVGVTAVVIDFCTYRGLIWLVEVPVELAKGGGFIIGTIFAYLANRYLTFGHANAQPNSIWRFMVLYAVTLWTNVLVNSNALMWFNHTETGMKNAFIVATAVSASLNFLGMKLFVFKVRQA